MDATTVRYRDLIKGDKLPRFDRPEVAEVVREGARVHVVLINAAGEYDSLEADYFEHIRILPR